MNPTSSFPVRQQAHSGRIASKWPVLARLPEVVAEPTGHADSQRTYAGSAAIDYRFDPPQGRALHHAKRADPTPRSARRDSPILPQSDPFAIPGSSLLDTVGAVARFLMLVALFTAAGVVLLSKRNDTPLSAGEKVPAARTAAQPVLKPAAIAVESSATATTAKGPAFVPDSFGDTQHAQLQDGSKRLIEEVEEELPDPIEAALEAGDKATRPYPQTAWPAPTFPETPATEAQTSQAEPTESDTSDTETSEATRTQAGTLPHVQTADPPQAVARLHGIITEIPSRQARHDDNQSGVH